MSKQILLPEEMSNLRARVVLWRYFVTGRPLYGDRRDNASFLHAATEDYRGKPVEKLSGPLWRRLARRWALAGVPVLMLVLTLVAGISSGRGPGWLFMPWPQLAAGWEAVAVLAYTGRWFYVTGRWLLRRRHTSDLIYPTAETACKAIGARYRKRDAVSMVIIPADYMPEQDIDTDPWWLSRLPRPWQGKVRLKRQRAAEASKEVTATTAQRRRWRKGQALAEETEPSPVRINLPTGIAWNDKRKADLAKAVGVPLGMPDPKPEWHLRSTRGRRPYVLLRPTNPPPALVTFDQIKRWYDKATLARPVLGLAAGNKPEYGDYDNNSPHWLLSGGSGVGKSVLAMGLFCQRMHHGAYLVVLDYKRVSHRWAFELPEDRCTYAWRIADIHTMLLRIGDVLEWRRENIRQPGESWDAPNRVFPTIDILVEEINTLTPMLQAYWAEIREPSLGHPVQSPAILALKAVLFMGREFAMHEHIAAQRASANTFGANGGDARENCQERCVARWTPQAWKMLANGLPYQRCPATRQRGIWAHISGDDHAVIFQAAYLTPGEARDYALSGVPCPGNPFEGELTAGSSTEIEPAKRTEVVTLSDALPLLPGLDLGLSLDALRKAAQRPGFPEPLPERGDRKAKLYDLQALIMWRSEQLGMDLEESFALPAVTRRPGIVYRLTVLQVDKAGMPCYDRPPVLGYVGQTRRRLSLREDEHRGSQPWADLIVGSAEVVWQDDTVTDAELDARELFYIETMCPAYNYSGQERAPHAVPKPRAVEQRYARDKAAHRPLWVPEDRYATRYAR